MKINSVKWNPQFSSIVLLERDHKLYKFSLFPYRRIKEADLTPVPYYWMALTNWREMGTFMVGKLGLEIQPFVK